MVQDITKAPRLYIDAPLRAGETCPLSRDHSHYLLSVMRKEQNDFVRVFNGSDGEFVTHIIKTSKKSAHLAINECIRSQPASSRAITLYFAPIKKDRLAILIEKATELGVTDFRPIITDHTENRHMRVDKVKKQIIEAAEQCERLDIPVLHPIINLHDLPQGPIYAAMERTDAAPFTPSQSSVPIGVMIGPEGGWSAEENRYLVKQGHITPVTLGTRILRAETAAIYMLSRIS